MMNFDDNKPYPDDVALLKMLGYVSLLVANPEDARKYYERALKLEPDSASIREALDIAKLMTGQALEADAIHFSTDILSSVVVLLGLIMANFGYFKADAISAIIVALIILYISYQLIKKSVNILLDRVPDGITEIVEKGLQSNPAIKCFHDLKIRTAGADTFVRVNVHLNSHINLTETHKICDEIEQSICKLIPRCDVVVHAEPDTAESIE